MKDFQRQTFWPAININHYNPSIKFQSLQKVLILVPHYCDSIHKVYNSNKGLRCVLVSRGRYSKWKKIK